jgi:hypothetical protein
MGFQFTDGSFELGYNGQPWGRRTSAEDVYYHLPHPVRRRIQPFGVEAVRAAREIRESRHGNILIPYSGGADSEGVCEAFRRAKIEFTPLVVVYEHGLNKHDVDYAFAYCRQAGLTPLIEYVDLERFYESGEALELGRMCQAWELAYLPVYSALLRHRRSGFFIGAGEAVIARVRQPDGSDRWIYSESERHYACNRFMAAAEIDGVPAFFQWSTELVHSVLCDPLFEGLANGMYAERIWGSSILKHTLYSKHLGLAPRTKYTGFESFGGLLSLHNQRWRLSDEAALCQNQSSDIEYWSQVANANRRRA